ncbi:MAG: hypothetical protein ABJA89_18345 [Lapillicoccus sp.]
MKSTHDRVSTTRRFGTGTMTRVLAGGIAAGSVVGLFAAAGPAGAAPEKVHKSYVCKYVSIPGEAERLQTGQNPIFVDNHALFRSNEAYDAADGLTYVGQQFNDAQVKSVVVVANTLKLDPEPSVDVCQTTPPTSPTSSTSTSSTSSTTSTTSSSSTTSTSPTSTTTSTSPTSTTSTSPTSTTSTSPATTTNATLIPPTTSSSTTTPATVATLYPLQPVNAGANSDGTAREVTVTPLRAALVLLVLFGLWVAFGGRLPHVNRIGSPRDGS